MPLSPDSERIIPHTRLIYKEQFIYDLRRRQTEPDYVRFKLWRARGAGIWGLLGQTHQDMRLPMYEVNYNFEAG